MGDEPAYPFTCKDNKVIIGVKSKYYRYEKLGDRDFYTLKIKCDRMKATIPSNRIPESYNRRRLFFGDNLSKKFEVHLKARELGKDGDDSSSDRKSYEKRSDSKSDKKAAKESKKEKKDDKKGASKEKAD